MVYTGLMSYVPDRPNYAFSINQMIRSYREMAKLSQEGLASLSMELYNAGILDNYITQPQIARWERDPFDGAPRQRRVKRLADHSIAALSILLQHALQRAGFEAASAGELADYLHAANDRYYNPKQASAFALEIDSLMSPWPSWWRQMAQESVRTMLLSMRAIYERYRLKGEDNAEK